VRLSSTDKHLLYSQTLDSSGFGWTDQKYRSSTTTAEGLLTGDQLNRGAADIFVFFPAHSGFLLKSGRYIQLLGLGQYLICDGNHTKRQWYWGSDPALHAAVLYNFDRFIGHAL